MLLALFFCDSPSILDPRLTNPRLVPLRGINIRFWCIPCGQSSTDACVGECDQVRKSHRSIRYGSLVCPGFRVCIWGGAEKQRYSNNQSNTQSWRFDGHEKTLASAAEEHEARDDEVRRETTIVLPPPQPTCMSKHALRDLQREGDGRRPVVQSSDVSEITPRRIAPHSLNSTLSE